MKHLCLIVLLAFSCSTVYAQGRCENNRHIIFKVPGGTPKVITKLGTAPQFPTLRNLGSNTQVYANIKAMKNTRYEREMNSLLRSLGYNGISDPSFTADDIQRQDIPFGAQGMLGDAAHHYQYSIIVVQNQRNITGWMIQSKNSGECPIYFMTTCGNAFHFTEPYPTVVQPPCPEPYTAKVKVKVFARYKDKEYCDWCTDGCQVGELSGVEVHKTMLASEKIDDIPALPPGSNYPVKVVYVDVDKRTWKKLHEDLYPEKHKWGKQKKSLSEKGKEWDLGNKKRDNSAQWDITAKRNKEVAWNIR